jgi:hypothetical protein
LSVLDKLQVTTDSNGNKSIFNSCLFGWHGHPCIFVCLSTGSLVSNFFFALHDVITMA